jgi:hypothetical protein
MVASNELLHVAFGFKVGGIEGFKDFNFNFNFILFDTNEGFLRFQFQP